MAESVSPSPKGLVVLPFDDVAKAETFAALVISQMPESAAPFVLVGTAYEYVSEETGERGQVIEIADASRFDVYQGQDGPMGVVLQRITQEAGHAGTEGSPGRDVPGGGAHQGR